MTGFDLAAYLDRLGLDRVPVSATGLRAGQEAQMRTVPFEAIDPFLGLVPDLAVDTIAARTVGGARGGYCFELNALFGAALGALGFNVHRSLGRVRNGAPRGGARSHLVLRVNVDGGHFLADCGFGGPGPLVPLDLGHGGEQFAPNGTYRVRDDLETGERVIEQRRAEIWYPLFGFDEAYVGDEDIAGANFMCARWEAKPFAANLMLAGYDGDTRIGVFNRALTLGSSGHEERRTIGSEAELAETLLRLRIGLDPAAVSQLWSRLMSRRP